MADAGYRYGIGLILGDEQGHVASSPPFFCGSPPSRASNPLVHDPGSASSSRRLTTYRPRPVRKAGRAAAPGSSPGSSRRWFGSRVLTASIAAPTRAAAATAPGSPQWRSTAPPPPCHVYIKIRALKCSLFLVFGSMLRERERERES
uniref:Uncharacterized protein n=1 Tax=Ananas comosus var. bracteatus TaxID=296719 RepID=A0A6V7NW57_ANACO|nr:unnamed protein product [Ananas comosus var. bracteatus]